MAFYYSILLRQKKMFHTFAKNRGGGGVKQKYGTIPYFCFFIFEYFPKATVQFPPLKTLPGLKFKFVIISPWDHLKATLTLNCNPTSITSMLQSLAQCTFFGQHTSQVLLWGFICPKGGSIFGFSKFYNPFLFKK